MNAEQAWQSALGQLQMEMPKASFDTWVRDTRIVSYDEGRFSIGVRNAYARDWLESRLSSTVTRLLMGMMNRSVDVQFVVAAEAILEEEVNEEDSEGQEDAPAPDQVEIEPVYDLAYDEIVQPEHVTLVSRYFLKHLRLIGPELGWLYLGFRQAAFNAGARNGSKHARFSGQIVASMSGIAERTFWNRIGNPETWERLRGLVSTSIGSPEWDTGSATPRRLPRRYTVAMSLPLTAADAHSLRTWLAQNVERLGEPERVIETAAGTPLDELLPKDAQAQEGDHPESVPAILRSLFGEKVSQERLEALATRLHKAIMPDNDRLGVTHFFVEHILPHLGTGPGWMLTLLRDRCYYNQETGEIRNRVRVAGGYAEIAGWIGLSRPMTVYEWLYGKQGKNASEPGKYKHPITRVYLREVEQEKALNFKASSRTFDVLLNEVPMEILQAAFAGEPPDLYANCSIGFTRPADDLYASCSIGFTRFADHLYATCRVFKSLNHLNPITNDSPPPIPSFGEAETAVIKKRQPARGVGNLAFWDFNFLMTNNSVITAGAILRRQKQTGATIERLVQSFVSWLLYAYSPSGQRVEDPVAVAARRLLENVSTGAGGDFDRLAKLHPYQLKAFFDLDIEGRLLLEAEDTLEREIYLLNFKDLSKPKKRELYRRLFGGE